ncbi:tetratricopeptide repeat protein [Actinoplanes sp. NPDC023936]|uniref:tetratricopeptide repeat protein n=1 Tax=Actinoplanes sp. NPDC023936 TaxID=3154910 RepID=UPI0034101AA4
MTELASSTRTAAATDAPARAFADPADLGVARAAALFEHLQPDRAAAILEPVLASHPQSVAGWILMARIRLALDQMDTALEAAVRAIELAPGDPRPLAIASRALTLLGRHDEAMSMAYRAVVVEPKNPLWHDRVAWALLAADRQLADAEQAARTAIGLDPNEAHYYFTHGMALAALGHVDQARQALATSLRLEPGNPVAKHRLEVLNGEAEPVAEKKKRGWKLFGR